MHSQLKILARKQQWKSSLIRQIWPKYLSRISCWNSQHWSKLILKSITNLCKALNRRRSLRLFERFKMPSRNLLYIVARLISRFNGKISMETYFLALHNNKVFNHNISQLDFHQFCNKNSKAWSKSKFLKNQNHKMNFKSKKIRSKCL